jgi:hypothetical protein
MQGAKRENMTIPVHSRQEKRAKSVKEPTWKKSKPKAEVAKTELSGLGYQSIYFFRTDRVRLGFKI